MPKYTTPVAAGIAASAVIAVIILLVTSPWSATTSQGSANIQGDVDCDQDVDAVDALFDLKWVAGIEPFGDCTEEAGDTDCSGAIQSVDGLHILRHLAALPSIVPGNCTPVGDPLDGTPTAGPTSTPSPSPTPQLTGSPDPSATPTPTPTATPADSACTAPSSVRSGGSGSGYALTQVIPAATQNSMIDLAVIPGTADREAVIITQTGYLYRVCVDGPGTILPFGDIHTLVNCCGEQGLLSLAFSPNYQSDSFLYLYYTRSDSSSACDGKDDQCSFISRYTVTNNTIASQPDNVVLRVIQPANNHNGGRLLFGDDVPTPYLYLGLGDGGGSGDPNNNGQNKDTMLGSIIRIDISSGQAGYDIPPDNPFVGTDGADEIWAWGFRNPWRMSFDRDTGELWVGDVGQSDWEEVDNVVKGANYGWVCFEGNDDERPNAPNCPPEGNLQFPEAVYINDDPDCAIVGGYVYRGSALPELEGWYIFSDNCSGRIRAFDTDVGGPPQILLDPPYAVSSLAELLNGEILVITFNNAIYQLVSD